MIRLKDAYRSGEENHLDNSGQVRIEVMSTPVKYAAVNQAPTRTALVIVDFENTLNTLGNC